MTRNKNGTVVAQCESKYVSGYNNVRCVKESGHDGEHTDARGEWNEQMEIETNGDDAHDAG